MVKRIPGVGVLVVGVVVFLVAIATQITVVNTSWESNLFRVAPAFEDMTDAFRPVMTTEAIAQAQQDVAALGAVSEEFTTAVVPTMSQQLGISPEQFTEFTSTQFPDVAAGVGALPTIVPQFTAVTGLLAEQQGNFASADAIPTSNLPVTTVPWMILLIGLAAVAVGAVMLWRPRLGANLALVLGALVVASTLAMSLVPKSGDADDLNAALKPVYTAELVEQSRGALAVIGAMGTQMQNEMLPALGEQLGLDQAQLGAFLGENFPATAAALADLPGALERFQGLVTVFDSQLDNYETIKPASLSPVAWITLIAGILIFLLGGWGVFGRRQALEKRAQDERAPASV